MNPLNKQRGRVGHGVGMLAWTLLFMLAGAGWVYAQAGSGLTTPLHIGTSQTIPDEFGEALKGHCSALGDLVQIYWASNGVAHPPDFSGNPHPENAPLDGGTTGIGALTDPAIVDNGIFSASIARPRPGDGSKLFVRVFNAPSIGDATFYGDSEIITVEGNKAFDVAITADKAIDTRDFDGDGLNNSWEGSYGTDPYNPDTDGDKMLDGDEIIAGTDAGDGLSYFSITSIEPLYGETYREEVWTDEDPESEFYGMSFTQRFYNVEGDILSWPSVAGRLYRVEYTTNMIGGSYELLPDADNLEAAPPMNVFTNTSLPDSPVFIHYRAAVWLKGE